MSAVAPVQGRHPSLAGRSIGVAQAAALALCVSGCSLIPGTITSQEASPSPAPIAPGPREPLGPQVETGRVEMPGAGFAITIPPDWTVEVADPVLDVTQEAAGTAWEALRAQAEDGDTVCSVYVGVAVEGEPIGGEKFPVDTSAAISRPEWREGPEGMQLVLPTPALASGALPGLGSGTTRWRPAGSHPRLPDGAIYALDCWSGREDGRVPRLILESLALLDLASTEP